MSANIMKDLMLRHSSQERPHNNQNQQALNGFRTQPNSVRNNQHPRLQQKTQIKEIILNNFMKKHFPSNITGLNSNQNDQYMRQNVEINAKAYNIAKQQIDQYFDKQMGSQNGSMVIQDQSEKANQEIQEKASLRNITKLEQQILSNLTSMNLRPNYHNSQTSLPIIKPSAQSQTRSQSINHQQQLRPQTIDSQILQSQYSTTKSVKSNSLAIIEELQKAKALQRQKQQQQQSQNRTASLFNQSLKLGIGQKSLDKINISPQTAESTQLRPLLIQTHESHRQSLRSNGSSQMVSPIQNNYLAYTQNNQLPLRNQQRKALKSQQNSILTSASKNANNNLLYQQQSPNNINNNNNNVNVFQRQMNTAASLAPLSVKSSHNAGNIHFNSTYTKSQNGMIKDVLPSEIDQDEWAEIARYQQEQDQEKKIKEQEAIMRRKQEVKAVLDAQLRERQKTIEMMTHEQKSFEVNLLKRLKDEETEDKKRQHERKLQIIQEKQKREQLLRQAQENKKQVFQKEMNSESEYLERLKLELEIEKQEQQNKRQKEMQEAQRIIKENQLIKMQKDKQRIVEKDEENKMLEQIKQLALDEERKRQELWEAREKKMEQAVNRMANTVVKKQEEQEKMIEQKVKKYEDEKEERDRNEEERRKEAMRMKNEQLKIALQEQLQQKILMKQEEQRQNEEYMRQWIGMGDQETKKIKSDERQRQIKLKENQIYLKDQIIGIKIQKNQPAVSKSPLRGAMNEEEIRLNRTLLLEISQKKKLQKTINTQQNQSISQGGDGISTHNFNGSGAQINTNFSQQ